MVTGFCCLYSRGVTDSKRFKIRGVLGAEEKTTSKGDALWRRSFTLLRPPSEPRFPASTFENGRGK